MGYAHPDQMLAGLDSRQLSEMYAFARIEPLDQPLQRMIAELANVLARVNGNETKVDDFLLVAPATPKDDKAERAQKIANLFAQAAKVNGKMH